MVRFLHAQATLSSGGKTIQVGVGCEDPIAANSVHFGDWDKEGVIHVAPSLLIAEMMAPLFTDAREEDLSLWSVECHGEPVVRGIRHGFPRVDVIRKEGKPTLGPNHRLLFALFMQAIELRSAVGLRQDHKQWLMNFATGNDRSFAAWREVNKVYNPKRISGIFDILRDDMVTGPTDWFDLIRVECAYTANESINTLEDWGMLDMGMIEDMLIRITCHRDAPNTYGAFMDEGSVKLCIGDI